MLPDSMEFDLVDRVLDRDQDRIVAIKEVVGDELWLADHFPTFPIMPGVLMLETMVQAAVDLLADTGDSMVLGEVRALKYGAMVKPGDALRVEVDVDRREEDGSVRFRGTGFAVAGSDGQEQTAVSGRFTMRPARLT